MDDMTKVFTERVHTKLLKIEAAHQGADEQMPETQAIERARLATQEALSEIEQFIRTGSCGHEASKTGLPRDLAVADSQ